MSNNRRKPEKPQSRRAVPAGVWVRFALLGAIWLWLCGLVLITNPVTVWNLFIIIASGIVVFVPMYKKYIRNDNK